MQVLLSAGKIEIVEVGPQSRRYKQLRAASGWKPFAHPFALPSCSLRALCFALPPYTPPPASAKGAKREGALRGHRRRAPALILSRLLPRREFALDRHPAGRSANGVKHNNLYISFESSASGEKGDN